MSRFWTSPNSCVYVPDYVYITISLKQAIPEPDYDSLISNLDELAHNHAIDQGGVVGRRYRVDEDVIYEDNPIATIDGVDYVTYTGELKVMCYAEDSDAHELLNEVAWIVKDYGACITQTEICGDF